MRAAEEILPVSNRQAYVKRLLICRIVVEPLIWNYDMEPSLSSETSILLAVFFHYCVVWKWYAKVNKRLNCAVTLK